MCKSKICKIWKTIHTKPNLPTKQKPNLAKFKIFIQTFQIKPAKPNQTKPNIANHNYQTKPSKLDKPTWIFFYWFPVFVTIRCVMWKRLCGSMRGCVIFLIIDLAEADNNWVCCALGNVLCWFEMHIIINSKQDSWWRLTSDPENVEVELFRSWQLLMKRISLQSWFDCTTRKGTDHDRNKRHPDKERQPAYEESTHQEDLANKRV